MKEPEVVYHFTSSVHLPDIMQSGFIDMTASNFSLEKLLYPVVWLTDLPTPHNHGIELSENIPDVFKKTHIRFTLRKRPHMKQWDAWSDAKGMDKQLKQMLIASASAEETYQGWYISEQPIRLAVDAICVENLHTGQILHF